MATIERKPLPPPNSSVTAITEADRAEIIARANDVIDHYLNGPGSYFDSGTREPLVGELADNTVADLKNFKDNVITSMQFADDPNSIMRSVVVLIDRAIEQVEKAARNNEGRDSIALPLPDMNDPIVVPKIVSNSVLPISFEAGKQPAPSPQAGETPGIASHKPVPTLRRRIADQSPASAFDTGAPAVLDRQDSFGARFGNWTSSPDRSMTAHNPNFPVSPPEPGRPLGIFSGKPMPLWTTPPPIVATLAAAISPTLPTR